jgi:hypothetical protein
MDAFGLRTSRRSYRVAGFQAGFST